MIFLEQKLVRILLALGIAAFLLTGFLGLSRFSMNMNMDGNMTMSDCPFMNGMTICNMNILDHIATWQNMFAHILPQHNSTAVFLLLLSLSLVTVGWIKRQYLSPEDHFNQFSYLSDSEYVPIVKPLQDLFQNGILNPKLF